jgi:ParB-like chromosome segregation protein Spo0J
VVDGFHRYLTLKTSKRIFERENGMLPCVVLDKEVSDRMASTIRHNRARGKHLVDGMSEIVQELARRNWNDEKIGRELGMDPDEVLRLCQITGLADVFKSHEFSRSNI